MTEDYKFDHELLARQIQKKVHEDIMDVMNISWTDQNDLKKVAREKTFKDFGKTLLKGENK